MIPSLLLIDCLSVWQFLVCVNIFLIELLTGKRQICDSLFVPCFDAAVLNIGKGGILPKSTACL